MWNYYTEIIRSNVCDKRCEKIQIWFLCNEWGPGEKAIPESSFLSSFRLMALKLRYLYGSRSRLSVNRSMLRHSLCKSLKTPLKNILDTLLNNALKLLETSLITILQEKCDLSHNSTRNNSRPIWEQLT